MLESLTKTKSNINPLNTKFIALRYELKRLLDIVRAFSTLRLTYLETETRQLELY